MSRLFLDIGDTVYLADKKAKKKLFPQLKGFLNYAEDIDLYPFFAIVENIATKKVERTYNPSFYSAIPTRLLLLEKV